MRSQKKRPAEAATSTGLTYKKTTANGNFIMESNENKEEKQMDSILPVPSIPDKDSSKVPEEKASSVAKILVGLMADAELFHNKDNNAYARIPVNDHYEVYAVRSSGFSQILKLRYYRSTGKTTNAQSLQDALGTLEAKAVHDGAEIEVHVRLASMEGKVYLDLCNKDWEVVEVSSTGWKIINDPPVMFVRSKGMAPLLTPVKGGSINQLRPFINVATGDGFVLFVGCLMSWLSPTGPYPILALLGGHGTAKSTATRICKRLIDPSTSDLRAQPKEVRDLMISAKNSWLIAYDNLSHIQGWLSDLLCGLSTGGGFATRQLYSNDDEMIFNTIRPIVLNSITEILSREDIRDRAIFLNLIPISEKQRKVEKDFWKDFDEVHPSILGVLLDGIQCALRNFSSVHLERTPRMADAAKWVTAAESAFGWGDSTFMDAYFKNREEAVKLCVEFDPVTQAICQLAENGEWRNTASELLQIISVSPICTDEVRKSREWPKTPQVLSKKLMRLSTVLLHLGIELKTERTGISRFIIIRKLQDNDGNSSSFSSSSSQDDDIPF